MKNIKLTILTPEQEAKWEKQLLSQAKEGAEEFGKDATASFTFQRPDGSVWVMTATKDLILKTQIDKSEIMFWLQDDNNPLAIFKERKLKAEKLLADSELFIQAASKGKINDYVD